ncbi:MAG TPA: hypothetical protein VHL98_04680 [Microvirga sp.]|jgi:hypothetical protein|nr:hypothetical protein [Microvirga sp.]
MGSAGLVFRFQALRVSYGDRPLRVLEEKFMPASQCTREAARLLFMKLFEDRAFARRHGLLQPDAVRFIDEQGTEILRYSSWDYLKETAGRQAPLRDPA